LVGLLDGGGEVSIHAPRVGSDCYIVYCIHAWFNI
jgi:hypothetical protein